MTDLYFKYKALSITPEGKLDDRSMKQVVEPIANSYFYLPTREKLNDPNEGIFKNQIQAGITAFLQGLVGVGERIELTKSIHDLARQISQSTDKSGVFSLSRTAIDELMWSHYSSSHCGIAIEYNLNQLTRFCSKQHLHRFPVEYVDNPPTLDMQNLQGHAGEAVRTMLGHKSPRWSDEEEFRVVLENMNGLIPHDYRAIKSITFGLNVADDVRKQIYESTKSKVPEFYEICKIPDTYLLERKLLEELPGESPAGRHSGVNWAVHFQNLDAAEKERIITIAEREIENDPHYEELLLAEKSTAYPSKAVLQYQSQHHLGLEPWSSNTKHYYEL